MSDTIAKILSYAADLSKPVKKTYIDTLFATEDNAAHRFDITLLRNGAALSMSGDAAVSAYLIRYSDNATVSLTGSVSGNVVSVTLTKSCYSKQGQFALIIKATTGSTVSTVFYGEGAIFASSTDTIVDEENVVPSISDLLAQIDAMEAATEAANTATSNANTATGKANTATTNANKAADDANTAAEGASGWANATMTAKTLAAGAAPTASVSTAEDGHKVITLGIPKGDTGATPKITVEVSTGAAGSQAQVSVSGTEENPVIHLTIPKGDTGAIENLTINGKAVESGTITITADDVRARPNDWMPKADDVGALAVGGTAADASKLGGIASAEYVRAGHVLTVGSGCRFKTINAAIEHAKTICSATERVLIKIMPGVYEEEIVLNPNPGIDFEGDDWCNTMIKYPSVYPNAPVYTCGQGSFRNLMVYSNCPDGHENPSYAVHVEYQVSADAGGVVCFERCKLQGRLGAAIGAGLGANAGVQMIDCLCISETTNAVYAHGYPASNISGQTFTSHRCDFRSLSGGNSLHVDDVNQIYGLTGSELTVECVCCRGDKMALRTAESTYQGYIPTSGDTRLSAYSRGNEFVGANYEEIYRGLYTVAMRYANGMIFLPWTDAHKFALTLQSVLDSSGSNVTGTTSLYASHPNGFILTTGSTDAGPYWVQAAVTPK